MIYLEIAYAQKDEAKPFGVRWDPKAKLWYFQGDVLPRELERFRPASAPKGPAEKIILDIPFSYRDIAARAGVRWDSEISACFFEKRPEQALPPELEGFEPKQFSWEEKIQRELNGGAFSTVPTQKSITLRSHQLAAVEAIFSAYENGYPGFLLADCEAQRLYRLAWKEFKKALEGIGTLSKQHAALVKSEAAIRLRQKSSLLKVEDSIELCLELLDNGRQVAISCEFLATMDAIEELLRNKKIRYARVDGRRTNNSHRKEAERLRYQRGDAPVIVFNVVEGISLHEGETNNSGNNVPRCQIDHDLRWSAIQAYQIDGRSHRDGKFAQVYWVVGKDTVDSRVAEVLLWKLESMGNLQGDSAKDFEEILSSIQKESA